MDRIKLDIIGLSYSQTQSGAYALVLEESEGQRRLPIVIGSSEAQAIAIELENMAPSRPLTHDLLKSFADEFEIVLEDVIIYNLVDGVFFAKLICNNGIKNVEIDSRTSDAIALAVRFGCPIYTYEFILSSAGFEKREDDNDSPKIESISDDEEEEVVQKNPGLNTMSVEDLNVKLSDAIGHEDYEQASKIRDEINRRS
jgi:uncharacterized protein